MPSVPKARREPDPPVARPWVADEDVFHLDELVAFEAAAGEGGGDHVGSDVFCISEVYEVVLREFRMGQDFHESGEAYGVDGGDSGDGFGIQHAIVHQAEFAVALGHEHVTVGEEGEAPGVVEARRHRDDLDLGGAAFGFADGLSFHIGGVRGPRR